MNLHVQNQLSPFQTQKPIVKKQTVMIPMINQKKNHGEAKPIRFLYWEEDNKQIKLSLDLKKYNYLLRTGPAAFIVYVASKSENNYFTKFMGDKYIPLVDTTLEKGIHIWNQVIYNEHKNIQLYQLQCILGEPFRDKQFRRQSLNMVENSNIFIHAETVLMSIVSILASEIVFILNNGDDEILENFYQVTKANPNPYYKLSVINLVENSQSSVDQYKWYQLLDNIKFTVIDENRFIINSGINLAEHPADVVFHWTLGLEMTLQKKQYKSYEIDFLTFFSISEIITKAPILELEKQQTVDEIFKRAISKQIKYEHYDIETSYTRQVREFCSSSEEVTVELCSQKLNQLREQALSLYYMQLSQFSDNREFQEYLKSIEKKINEIEQECIKLNFDLIDIELTQQFDKIEKKYKDDFPDSYSQFLADILKFREFRGLKYQRLRKHLTSFYPSKLFDMLSKFEKEQKQNFESRMQTQNQKHLGYLTLREKELSEEITIVQNYVDNMKKQVKNLPTLIEFENQQNIVIQKNEIIRKQDKEIALLKQSIDLQKSKKNDK